MRKQIASAWKAALTRAGKRISAHNIGRVRVAAGYLALGNWVHTNGWTAAPRVESRNAVFEAMMLEVGDDAIAYLEFGVYQGHSFRRWVSGITNPDAEFHGFDSFEGLPETFDAIYGAGHFDVSGRTPDIADPRVQWHVGWFDDTLPDFDVPAKRLVITLDADLYSATRLVLDTLNEHIGPGTVLYFDELSRIDHEPAAFDDYRRSSGKRFEPIAFEKTLNTGAFVCC